MEHFFKVQLEDLPEVDLIERRLTTPKGPRAPFHSLSTSQTTPRKKRTRKSELAASDSATDSPSPKKSVGSSNELQSPQRARRRLDMELTSNYGSEDDNSEGDDDVAMYPIPKTVRTMIDNVLEVEELPDEQKLSPPSIPSSLNIVDSTHLGEYKPTNMFDFQWDAFPMPPIPSFLRRETFLGNSGPRVHYAEPYDAFIDIWDRQIMEHICKQTNLYVQQMISHLLSTGKLSPQSRITRWKDIDVDELYVYFAVLLAMGVVVKTRIEDYWSTGNRDIFITPGFSIYMSINRFCLINRWLHFNDNLAMDISQLSRSQAKLFKLQPIIDHLNHKFSSLYCLGQNVALDESLTQWKGLLDIKQYISRKSAVTGIKTYELCDSQSGYLWRFETHCGFDPSHQSGPVSGATASIVLKLIQGLEFKGHTLWMDNYYNSPALARTLKSMQTDCVGTMRANRRFVPASFSKLTKAEMAKNEIVGCTSGDVDIFVWRDRKCVCLISTYHGATTSRCGEVLKPTLVHDYNSCMGGVDKKDQMLAMYPIERKRTKIWYKKFFRRLLNVSVLNAYIMYKFNTPGITHREFRVNLVRQLLQIHENENEKNFVVSPSKSPHCTLKFPAEVLKHLPAEYEGGKSQIRRLCAVCKQRTHTYCPSCNVPLCVRKRGSFAMMFCYRRHHS